MHSTPSFTSVTDLAYGRDPELDAWLLHFMTENNIEYTVDPVNNASPEMLRFMVALGPDRIYTPCSDEMLRYLLDKNLESPLLDDYNTRWNTVRSLIDRFVTGSFAKKKIMSLCEYKIKQAMASPVLIPSRLMKRLNTIFLTQSGLDDPHRERKRVFNRRAGEFIADPFFDRALNYCIPENLNCRSMREMRFELDSLELRRLLCMSTWSEIWERDAYRPTADEMERKLDRAHGDFNKLREMIDPRAAGRLRILYLADASGGVLFDLLAVRTLLRLGHRVVMSLKEGFYFDAPTVWDADSDPVLAKALEGSYFLSDNRASKNELLKVMRENPFVIISDGTRERLNLHRVSVTFARAWKEADLVLAKGPLNYRRLMLTSHKFTRDVICFYRGRFDDLHLAFKPKAEGVRKFTEAEILGKAETIVAQMREARAAGRNVMFYSAIIGSIPHQTDMAIKILNGFIKYLREIMPGTFIVNPAEHFEEGLDGDDLMYMWEKVQRSGQIDVWRFQTHYDIEKSFELMGEKMTAIWAGKDSTYSTGCTKEMHIALSVQAKQPELQIIGPNPEKFFRRREYGIGKFFDAGIE
ncbi:MAG: DUF89 family protein [Desulfovibrionaceae bacterium]|nr:DUF89 family protein [Desulfovibrionaceae bacterium]MBF0513255.1 DUF89 family protein [Desulfovibrionaceae bacterium]